MATVQKSIILRGMNKGQGFGRVLLRYGDDRVWVTAKATEAVGGRLLLLTEDVICPVGKLPIVEQEAADVGRGRVLAAVTDEEGRVLLVGESGGKPADWTRESYRILRWIEGHAAPSRKVEETPAPVDMGLDPKPFGQTHGEADVPSAERRAEMELAVETAAALQPVEQTEKGKAQAAQEEELFEEECPTAMEAGAPVKELPAEEWEALCASPDAFSPKLSPRRFSPVPGRDDAEREDGEEPEDPMGMEGWAWERIPYGEEDCYYLGTHREDSGTWERAVAIPAKEGIPPHHLRGFVRKGNYWVLIQQE